MNHHYESMLRATDAASMLALLREFIAEARNVQAHLEQISEACAEEQNAQHA